MIREPAEQSAVYFRWLLLAGETAGVSNLLRRHTKSAVLPVTGKMIGTGKQTRS
jgi:hypothetical protein